jgi:hypothetical protein
MQYITVNQSAHTQHFMTEKNFKCLLLNVQLQRHDFLFYVFLKREAWWLSGAAETRSSLGHYRRFGTTYRPHPRCKIAHKSSVIIYFAVEAWNHEWSFLDYYNKLLRVDCFIVMYCALGQMPPIFLGTILRNVGRNSTTDKAAQLAPQQHRCENVEPSTQHPAPRHSSNWRLQTPT